MIPGLLFTGANVTRVTCHVADQCGGQWVTPGTRDRWVAVAPSYHSRASLCHEWKLPSGS